MGKVYKNIGIIVLIMLTGIILFHQEIEAGWPINRTPPIEGVVTDEITGKPIENVVVSCEWVRSVDTFGGKVRKGIAWESSVTDKDGKYQISAKATFHIFSTFNGIEISYSHPLYETRRGFGNNSGIYIENDHPKRKDGIIHCDIKLLSLEEKYVKEMEDYKLKIKKEQITQEEKDDLIREKDIRFMPYYGGTKEMIWYFKMLKEKHNVVYDLDYVYGKWEKLGLKMFGEKNEWFKRKIEEIKLTMGELKKEGY